MIIQVELITFRNYQPYDDVRRYVFDVMAHAVFGDYVDQDQVRKQKLFEASKFWVDDFPTFMAFQTPWPWFMAWPKWKLDKQMDVFGDFETELLKKKRDTGHFGDDWLGLLASNSINGTFLSDEKVKAISFKLISYLDFPNILHHFELSKCW